MKQKTVAQSSYFPGCNKGIFMLCILYCEQGFETLHGELCEILQRKLTLIENKTM